MNIRELEAATTLTQGGLEELPWLSRLSAAIFGPRAARPASETVEALATHRPLPERLYTNDWIPHGLTKPKIARVEPKTNGLIRGTQVIVDMQPMFLRGEDRSVVNNVGKLVDMAKERNLDILLVEFGQKYEPQMEPTVPLIADRLKYYPKARTIQKFKSDGSPEIDAALTRFRMWPCTLQFSGVWVQDCVMSSAVGIHRLRPLSQIEILEAAANKYFLPSYTPLKEYPNMNFVRTPIEQYT